MLQKIIAIAISTLGLCIFLYAEEPTATTGPNVRLIFAPKQLTSQTGFALMGEVGEKMGRINATLGYQIGPSQRLKLSIDQLAQKLTYNFYNGNADAWVRQIAGGFGYKYLLNDYYVDSIDAGGWYSNSPNIKLSPLTVPSGTTSRIFERRVSGSEAWHGYLGTTLLPWPCGSIGLAAVYDHVHYTKKTFQAKAVSGAGLAIDFNQRLFSCLDLGIKGDILQPYQHVGGVLNWTCRTGYGNVIVGLYGDYTQGRKGLPNDVSYGIQFNMAFGNSNYLSPFYGRCCVRDKTRPRQDLFDWIADPAVLMPIVLAIADQCNPPAATALPDTTVGLGPFAINVSSAFLSGRCFSVKYSAKGLPPGATINEDSGVISGTNIGLFSNSFNVTVTGSCICGAATSSFLLTYESL